jgi:hypothetical protein
MRDIISLWGKRFYYYYYCTITPYRSVPLRTIVVRLYRRSQTQFNAVNAGLMAAAVSCLTDKPLRRRRRRRKKEEV